MAARWITELEPKRKELYGWYCTESSTPKAGIPPWWPTTVPYRKPQGLPHKDLIDLSVNLLLHFSNRVVEDVNSQIWVELGKLMPILTEYVQGGARRPLTVQIETHSLLAMTSPPPDWIPLPVGLCERQQSWEDYERGNGKRGEPSAQFQVTSGAGPGSEPEFCDEMLQEESVLSGIQPMSNSEERAPKWYFENAVHRKLEKTPLEEDMGCARLTESSTLWAGYDSQSSSTVFNYWE